MSRTVHQGDAVAWLQANRILNASVITSLPDISEVPTLGFPGWVNWFESTAALVIDSVPPEGVAIFFQSDIRHQGLWVDKGAMIQRAADRSGARLLFHKIVCRKPAGTITFGRVSYSHLLAFSSTVRPAPSRGTPDVLPEGGPASHPKAMGLYAAALACRFVLTETTTRTVVDPFCGFGTVLAVANALGMDAVGVDLSTRMCRKARSLQIEAEALTPRPV